MLELTWVATVAGVVAAVFAVLAWLQARGRPEWELLETRDPERWVLRRVGHSVAHITNIINFHNAPVTVHSDRGGLVHDLPPGGQLVLTLGHFAPGTYISVEWTTRWRRKPRWWSSAIY